MPVASHRLTWGRVLLAVLTAALGLFIVGVTAQPALACNGSCGESDTDLHFYTEGGESSLTSQVYGQAVLFSAIVADDSDSCHTPGDCDRPSGHVYFFDGAATGYFVKSPAQDDFYTPGDQDITIDNLTVFNALYAGLAPGLHSITAKYQGGISSVQNPRPFDDSQDTQPFTITQAATSVSLSANPTSSTFGGAVGFTATVTPSPAVRTDLGAALPTGNVQLSDVTGGGNVDLGTAAINGSGVATFSISNLPAGTRTLQANYQGDTNYTGNAGQTAETVSAATTSMTVSSSPNPSTYGNTITAIATLSPTTATGSVSITLGTTTHSASIVNGIATTTFSGFSVGTYGLSASYAGDSNHTAATATGNSQTVNKTDTQTAVTLDHDTAVYGQPVVATAAPTPTSATGSVEWFVNGPSFGTSSLSGQPPKATFSVPTLSPGAWPISATYGGDANHNASTGTATLTVTKANTTTAVSGFSPSANFGSPNNASVLVAAVAPGSGTPTGTVTFTEGPNTIGSAALSGGAATFDLGVLVPGTHTITAAYGGDGNFNTSQTQPFTVSVTCQNNQTTPVGGSMTVGSGSTCISAPSVGGNVYVPAGARVFFNGTKVLGQVVAVSGPARLVMCGSTVNGRVTIDGATGPVQLGDPATGCAGNTLGATTITNSHGGVTVAGNNIRGALACSGNAPAPTNKGQPNAALARSGQCAGL